MFAVLQSSAQTSVSYTYDDLNRLTEVSYSNGVKVKYTYDALGNRTKKTVQSSAAGLRGDVNGNGVVDISDVTALINYVLTGNAQGLDLNAANVNGDNNVDISDVTTLIGYVLTGTW